MNTFKTAIESSKLFTIRTTTGTTNGKAWTKESAVATADGKKAIKEAMASLLNHDGAGLVPVMADLGVTASAVECHRAFLTACKATKQDDDSMVILLRGDGVHSVSKLIPVMYALLAKDGKVNIVGKKSETLRGRLADAEKKATKLEALLKAHPELAAELATL